MTAKTLNLDGSKAEKAVSLSSKVFGQKAPLNVMSVAVRVFRANNRRANAKTKNRGEVRATTAKMYKQKGTGNARHGAHSAPQFVGGGVAFGPTGEQNYTLKLNKNISKSALLGALHKRASDAMVYVLNGDLSSYKTKEASNFLKKANINGSVLFVSAVSEKSARLAFRNIPRLIATTPNSLSCYSVLSCKNLLFTQEGILEMNKKYEV